MGLYKEHHIIPSPHHSSSPHLPISLQYPSSAPFHSSTPHLHHFTPVPLICTISLQYPSSAPFHSSTPHLHHFTPVPLICTISLQYPSSAPFHSSTPHLHHFTMNLAKTHATSQLGGGDEIYISEGIAELSRAHHVYNNNSIMFIIPYLIENEDHTKVSKNFFQGLVDLTHMIANSYMTDCLLTYAN